jgi:rubrerythrin
MSLTTFGAIMAFSFEMVRYALDTYSAAVQKAKDPALKETLEVLLQETKKNLVLMEQIRRENITEMILEPIHGLQRADYEMDVTLSDQTQDSGLVKTALSVEEKMRKFFYEASAKVPIPEVKKLFLKIVPKKERNLTKLESLSIGENH